MSTSPRRQQDDRGLRSYLEALAGDRSLNEFMELRHRVSEQTLVSTFFATDELDELAREIRARGRRTDVYVGCAPRARRAGTKDAVARVWVLWAECDGAQAARAAHAWRPRPAIVVGSGSGPNLHAYWPLTAPLPAKDAEIANLRLAAALDADAQCFDASRILRPPGTWNHKRQPPRPVALVRLDAIRFDPDEVVAHAPEVATTAIERRWRPQLQRDTGSDPLLRIPPATYVRHLLGSTPGRDHKVHCPFHEDQRPSLHVYPTPERGWCCYSCGRGGSIYDLAAPLWGLATRGREFLQLRELLAERFDLARTIDGSR